MCAGPGVLTSKLAFHPPLAPFRFRFHPQQGGRPGQEPRWVPTDLRACLPPGRRVSWGNLSLHVLGCGLARSKQSDNCHLPFTSAIHGRLRQSTRGRPRPTVGVHPSPSPNPHSIARNMGHQGSGTL